MKLSNRVAIVFGAGSSGPGWGNGKAAAVHYAREGATVIAVDIRAEAAEETAAIITAEGHQALAFAADVTSEPDIAAVIAQTLQAHSTIDILHNNVGITDMGDLSDITEQRWQRVMDINLKSAFLTCRAVLPTMQKQSKGAIINVSSLAGAVINQYPYYSYYASKAALNHFTRALAVRHAHENIRANVIMPGVLNTPLIHTQITTQYESTEAMLAARNAMSPMRRMGDAWDIAKAAAFLASDDAAYITGICLPVDGGLSCLAAAS